MNERLKWFMRKPSGWFIICVVCVSLGVSAVWNATHVSASVPVPVPDVGDLTPNATHPYVLETPFGSADYYIGKYSNGSVYVVNGSNWDNFGVGTNVSKLFEDCVDSLSSGGKIVFGSGSYSVTSSLNYTNDKVEVWGSGDGTVFELDADVPMFVSLGFDYIGLYHVVCDGNDRNYHLVDFQSATSYSSVEGCTFYDCGVSFVDMDGIYNTFAGNKILNRGDTMGVNSGAGLEFGQDGYVYDNTIDVQYGGNGLLYTGILLDGAGVVVRGNHITYNLNYSVWVQSGDCLVVGNWFDSPYVSAIYTSSLTGLLVSGNVFLDGGWDGGYAVDINGATTGVNVVGNYFNDGGTGGGAVVCVAIETNTAGNCTGSGNWFDPDIADGVWKNPACTGTLTVLNVNGDFNYYKAP